ncbi:PDDEXK nuclease domain-containing protein [Sphaerotilus sp.]|uniref:PDDEXK nuclease domain-containing protein n=1 Tax=Sphaerotilus sp. TaxID=2093942 RepID=UPI0025DE6FEE|nr:PDDEXK nuclease domain-containing protein [Sphaerotilus sp.]
MSGDLQPTSAPDVATLLADLRALIDEGRQQVAVAVNVGLTLLYWRVGQRIRTDLLQDEDRAAYGERIVATLSRQLTQVYGKGFTRSALNRMVQFAEAFPESQIVATLSQQLSWSHFVLLLPLTKPLQRDFYAEMCRLERWSVRTLGARIDSMLYERTALSKQPDALIQHELQTLRETDRVSPALVFRDPYFLDFLGLNDRYVERDVEDAIMRELEQFLLELGGGFSFIARQKRIPVGGDDYFLDLLFFHRGLRRLIAIELKLGDFKPADKGQMELYLRWLDKYERQPGEDAPLGLILCAGQNREAVELLELERSGIHVAEYLTALPAREVLERKLHEAVLSARARLGLHQDNGESAV